MWSLRLTLFLTSVPPFISNAFYLTRLYKIGYRSPLILGGITLLVLARLGLELASSSLIFRYPKFADHARYRGLSIAFCSISSAADLILAILITKNLLKMRAGYKRSDQTVQTIVAYLLATGILTSVVCTLSLISIITIRYALVDEALHGVLGKLYGLSVLAVLNSRQSHERRSETADFTSGLGADDDASSASTVTVVERLSKQTMESQSTRQYLLHPRPLKNEHFNPSPQVHPMSPETPGFFVNVNEITRLAPGMA